MKNYFALLLLLATSFTCFSQSTLKVENDYWSGFSIYQNGTKISINQAKEIVKNNQMIVEKLGAAQTNRTIGAIIGYPGAFALGYTNWTVGGIGGVLMIGGAILQGKGNKQLKEAVTDYNETLKKTASIDPELYILANENGFGLTIKF
jgi:predicted amino acid dehydrogenase